MVLKGSEIPAAEAALVEGIASGDEESFRQALTQHQGLVYGYALRMLGDAALAEDVAQEVFLRLFRTAGKYKAQGSLRGYLMTICRNLCIDNLRRAGMRVADGLDNQPGPHNPLRDLETKQTAEVVNAALAALPVNQRSAVVLRHGQGMSYAEMASVMATTVSAVESLLVRARRALRNYLKDYLNP